MAASSPTLEPSPAAGAIGFASLVVLVALLGYAVTTALDDWPALMLAALGAMLGASFATTRIVAHDMDPRPVPPWPDGWTPRVAGLALATPRAVRSATLGLHATIAALAGSVHIAGRLEEPRLLGLTLTLGVVWFALFRGVLDAASPPEVPGTMPAEGDAPDSVFPALFQASASLLALTLLYLAVTAETPWLWRPAIWDDFQAPLLFVLLEAVTAPVAAIARRRRTSSA